jgi:hypothetical protein
MTAATDNGASRLVQFTTDLPVRSTPVGRATIAVIAIEAAADGRSMERTALLLVDAAEVELGPALALPATAPAEPLINRRAPNATGVAQYSVVLDAAVTGGVVVVTDPLGRAVERSF